MDDMADLGKILQGDSMADLFSDDFTPVESTLQQAKEINEAAATYKGVIPADCWKEPYMSEQELQLPHFFRRSGFYLKAFTGEQHSRRYVLDQRPEWRDE